MKKLHKKSPSQYHLLIFNSFYLIFFLFDVDIVPDNLQIKLVELQCYNKMRIIFGAMSKIHFYNSCYIAKNTPNCDKIKFAESECCISSNENLQNQLRYAILNIEVDLIK